MKTLLNRKFLLDEPDGIYRLPDLRVPMACGVAIGMIATGLSIGVTVAGLAGAFDPGKPNTTNWVQLSDGTWVTRGNWAKMFPSSSEQNAEKLKVAALQKASASSSSSGQSNSAASAALTDSLSQIQSSTASLQSTVSQQTQMNHLAVTLGVVSVGIGAVMYFTRKK